MIFLLGPTLALIGHVYVCHDFDVSSRIMMCASGDRVPQLWLYAAIAASVTPLLLLIIKHTYVNNCELKELGEEGCIPCEENEK